MKTGKKIAVGFAAALVVAMFAAGAVSMVGAQLPEATEALVFTVGVSAFNVHIDPTYDTNTDFGPVLAGVETEIHSFNLANEGDVDTIVSAKFLTTDGDVYGFTGGSVIPAENFKINDVALDNNGDAKEIDIVESGETKECHTKLLVPPGTPGADYSGEVELIFTVLTRQP